MRTLVYTGAAIGKVVDAEQGNTYSIWIGVHVDRIELRRWARLWNCTLMCVPKGYD
jgi:hypothetical protein